MAFPPDIYRNGIVVAIFVRYLKGRECDKKYDSDPLHFTDGNKLYRKLINQ